MNKAQYNLTTIKEAAELAGISAYAMRKIVKCGQVDSVTIGQTVYVKAASLESLMASFAAPTGSVRVGE